MLSIVGRVPASVEHDHLAKVEGRQTFEASDIDAELVRVRAALVVRINAADRAEMMLRGLRVEAISRKPVLALRDPERVGRRGHRHCPAHPADRAGATAR